MFQTKLKIYFSYADVAAAYDIENSAIGKQVTASGFLITASDNVTYMDANVVFAPLSVNAPPEAALAYFAKNNKNQIALALAIYKK